jgi:cytoskeletal protein RodZ
MKSEFFACRDCADQVCVHKIFKIGFTGISHRRIILTVQDELAENLEKGKNRMRKLGRIFWIVLVLLTAGLMLSGCGRRGALERLKAVQTETVTVELQPIEQQSAMPAQETGTQVQQTASPSTSPDVSISTATTGTDTDWNAMMDDLESTLDGLENAIASADQDALTDAALIALGK